MPRLAEPRLAEPRLAEPRKTAWKSRASHGLVVEKFGKESEGAIHGYDDRPCHPSVGPPLVASY
jgi:hypothetical protein